MSTHAIEVVSEYGELSLRLICHAAKGALCRMRPADLDVEEWSTDYEGDLIDTECWAVEYVAAAGFEDAIRTRETGVLASVPISVGYDECVLISTVDEGPMLDGIEVAEVGGTR